MVVLVVLEVAVQAELYQEVVVLLGQVVLDGVAVDVVADLDVLIRVREGLLVDATGIGFGLLLWLLFRKDHLFLLVRESQYWREMTASRLGGLSRAEMGSPGCFFGLQGALYDIRLLLPCIFVELQQRRLLLVVAHAVRVPVHEVGLHYVEDGRVVPFQILRYLADRDTVDLVLVNDVDTLFVRDELLRQPLLLRLAQSLRHHLFLTFPELLYSLNLIL